MKLIPVPSSGELCQSACGQTRESICVRMASLSKVGREGEREGKGLAKGEGNARNACCTEAHYAV